MGPYDERRASDEKMRRVWEGRTPPIESLEQANKVQETNYIFIATPQKIYPGNVL